MKTIELDLEKDSKLDSLSGMLKSKKINLGHESFELKIHSSYVMGNIVYAGLLLLLVKYLNEERNRFLAARKLDLTPWDDARYFDFYVKNYDVNKLESKIEKDFKVNIEIEKKNPLDDVFGIWKNERLTLGNIREKAWQRAK